MKKYEEIINLFTNFNLSFSEFDIKIRELIYNSKTKQTSINDDEYLNIIKTIFTNKLYIYEEPNDKNNFLDIILYRFIKISYYFNINNDVNQLILEKLNSLENKKEIINLLNDRFIDFHNNSFTNQCYLELKLKILSNEENQEFLIYEIKKDMADLLNKHIEKSSFLRNSSFNNILKDLLVEKNINFIQNLELTKELSLKITLEKKYEEFIKNKKNQTNILKIVDILLLYNNTNFDKELDKNIDILKISFEKSLIHSKIKPNLNNNIKGINKL